MLLARLLRKSIRHGSLTLIDAHGRTHKVGESAEGFPDVTVRLTNPRLHTRLFWNPSLAVGEAYMDGTLRIEQGDVYDLMALAASNTRTRTISPFGEWAVKAAHLIRAIHQRNPLGRAQTHVAHHYDLSGELYRLFLDPDQQYSCAYFPTPDTDLPEAQEAKKRHLAAKLLLEPGHSVLDIGSGWGGLGIYLARETVASVTGVTMSTEQHDVSNERARKEGLQTKARFLLEDYRKVSGHFDRIVSAGMFEHVGVPHYPEFFAKVRDLLADDGVAVLHSIGRSDGPGVTNAWIRKYIFPGGYVPALSEVLPVIERAGMWVTDIEILRLHYAGTLRHWRKRFQANREKVAQIYDERFCRLWEFYLAGSEVSFRYQGMMVFQIQLAKRVDTVPLTRDYITDWERAHAPSARQAAAAE